MPVGVAGDAVGLDGVVSFVCEQGRGRWLGIPVRVHIVRRLYHCHGGKEIWKFSCAAECRKPQAASPRCDRGGRAKTGRKVATFK